MGERGEKWGENWLLKKTSFLNDPLSVLSQRGSPPLKILFVNSFKGPSTFSLPIIKSNFFDNSPMLFGLFVIFKRCCLVSPSNKSSSVFPSFHRSILPVQFLNDLLIQMFLVFGEVSSALHELLSAGLGHIPSG